jgi:PAS domain S-box-containing protein
VHADKIEVGAFQALPVPRAISLEQALSGSEDSQWVEMRGYLRDVNVLGTWVRLTLTSAAGDFTVSIPHAAVTEAKVGSFLLARGVCQPWLNDKSQIGGVFLFSPSLHYVEVAEPPLADPFAAPEEAIGNLPQYRTEPLQQQQVLIRGIVLHHVPGRYVMVENATGVVRALSRSDAPLSPGDHVDVVGIPGHQGNQSVLRSSVYRRTGSGPAPVPLDPQGGLKLDPALEGRLVTVTGRLVNLLTRREDTRLMVQVGNSVLELVYQGALPAGVTAEWKPGSQVAVTGLYGVEYDDDDRPVKFAVQFRTPADVVVQARPPWWTAGRALTGLGVIGVCLVFGLVWVAALRRRVRQQTGVIRTQFEKEASLQVRHGEIIENASDFIFTTDLAGNFTSVNPAGERLTGYRSAEALKLGIRDLISPEDVATGSALLALAHLPEQTPAARFETRFQSRDGRVVWLETSVRLIHEAGRPAGLLGIARDVTARKQTEAKKARMEELNRQLQKTESLGRMAGAIAHHFNNQLHVVMFSLELAMDDLSRQADPAGNLATAMQSARKAAEVSTLMLTYLGQSHGEREPLDLSEACRRALTQLRGVLPKSMVVESEFPSPGPVISANANLLQQVLANLLTNSWEAGGDAGGAIRLSVTTVSAADIPALHRFPIDCHLQDRAYACLAVADSGSGISEQDLGKIFDPFFSSKSPGRGMGLAVVLGITRTHDGAITVQSEPGRGSVFRVFLPVAG